LETEGTGLDISGRQVVLVLGLAFAVTLAIFVGKRMSAEAMAVVVGVVCGVAAGIPTSVLLLVVMTRRERQRTGAAEQQPRQGSYPPVVVIQGGAPQALPQGPQAGYWPTAAPGPMMQRQFHVIGDDDLVVDG
jgi:hypothetical protein